jgi:hypothetical protein
MSLSSRSNRSSLCPLLAAAAPLLAATACGGGGGGGEAVRDTRPPTAQVAFPSASGQTDAAAMTVSGTASDPDGVRSVLVGGVAATTSDGFAHWSADVSLAAGAQAIRVDVIDGRGALTRGAARFAIEGAPTFADPIDVVRDAAHDRLLVIDLSEEGVNAIDLASGACTRFADANHGSGPFTRLKSIALDPGSDRVVALDDTTVWAIDLASGDRTELSGGGPALFAPHGLEVDSANRRAYTVNNRFGSPELLQIDLVTGDREIISSSSVGSGPLFTFATGIALVPAGATVLVAAPFDDAIFAVDTASGNRSIVADSSRGTGPKIDFPISILSRADGSVAFVAQNPETLLAVNPVTGDRTIVADASHGAGPRVTRLGEMTFLDDAATVIAAPAEISATVISIDLATGDRADLAADLTGDGLALDFANSVAIDAARHRALVSAGSTNVFAVDLASSDRTVFTGAGRGSGPTFQFMIDVDIDDVTDRAIVFDSDALLAVDLATGDRTLLSGKTAGDGPAFASIVDFVVDPARRLAFVLDGHFVGSEIVGRLLAVDLADGDRLIVSDENRGSGPTFAFDTQIRIDSSRNRALVVDNDSESLFAVNLVSGDRTVISGAGVGSGPPFQAPRAFAIASDGRHAIVVDFVTGGHDLFEVDLDTGDRTIVMAVDSGNGPRLKNVRSLVPADGDGRYLAVDQVLNALVLVDLASGERVIVSQ